MTEKSVSSQPVHEIVDGYSITASVYGYAITDPKTGNVVAERKTSAQSCSTTWAQAARVKLAEVRHGSF